MWNTIKVSIVLISVFHVLLPVSAVLRLQMERHVRTESSSANGAKARMSLTNHFNVAYTSKVGVGTPPQYFNVLFDTGSTSIWFPVGSNPGCDVFDPSKSSTYKGTYIPVALKYGKGQISGYVANDTITFSGIKLNQSFVAADYISDFSSCTEVNGLIGLGFKALNAITVPTKSSFIGNIFNQKLISKPVFSFYLSKDLSEKSELLIGGIDSSHYEGKLRYVKLVSESYWKIKLDKVMSIPVTVNAIVDSGTSYIMVPPIIADLIYKKIDFISKDGALPQVSCSDMSDYPDVSFTIDGHDYLLRPKDYLVQEMKDSERRCYVAIKSKTLYDAITREPLVILGEVFMRKFYTVFNYEKKSVGLATVKGGAASLSTSSSSQLLVLMQAFISFIFVYNHLKI